MIIPIFKTPKLKKLLQEKKTKKMAGNPFLANKNN